MRSVRFAAFCTALAGLLSSGCAPAPARENRWAAPEAASAPSPAVSPVPSSPEPSPTPAASPSARPSAPRSPRPATAAYVFPVVASPLSYHRTHSGYPATDIFAACGSPVRAVTDGVVLEVSRADRFDPASPDGALKGGLFVSIKGDDGVRYYGSHLSAVVTGIERGVRVRAGQRVGSVGRTGDASNVCHLHFGISPPCRGSGDWSIRRGVVWPWSYLDAWRKGTAKSPVATVTAWHRDHGCP